MGVELDVDPTGPLIEVVQGFHVFLDHYRPGARYVLTTTDEATMLAFCDHGGELRNETMRLSSGPLRPHAINPGWRQPSFAATTIRVTGKTGDVQSVIPPILWVPGPGSQKALPR